jgi:hypothetical protein
MVAMMNGGAIMWRAKQQTVVATSTCEAEYIAASEAAKEALWLGKLLAETIEFRSPMKMHVDNQSAITLMTNNSAGSSGKTKHIDISFHFVRHRVMMGHLEVKFVSTAQMKADVMTKGMAGPGHKEAVRGLGLATRPALKDHST